MTLSTLRMPSWSDHGIGAAIALVWIAILISTSTSVGVPRDESFYFHAADRSADWFERLADPDVRSFSRSEIDRGFKYNREHPVLMKNLFGLSHRILNERLGWVDDHILAYRLPTMVMAGLALWLAWLLGVMIQGRAAGFVAVVALACMPRLYFHSHLACFDGPVNFMWLLIAYTFLRASRSRAWAIACGVCLGLGFATKLNIFFLPFALLGVALWDVWRFKRRTGQWRAPDDERGPLTWYTWIALSMIVIGFAVFWAHWPWLYYDIVPRLQEYVAFHARHVHYPVDYLGFLYFKPPFPLHFPVVMTLVTVPIATLILGGIGTWVTAKRCWADYRAEPETEVPDRRVADVFILVNLFVPLLIIAMPYTPIFGGTKHWITAMPFLAVCAGIGAVRLTQGLWPGSSDDEAKGATTDAGEGIPAWRILLVGVLMLTPAMWATAEYGAHGPAYFNALIGGPPGAADAGMPRNFWGYSTVEILDEINAESEKRPYVFWHKATRGAIDAYKRDGLLRKDVRYTGDWTAAYSDWAVYHDQREKLPEELDIWRAYGTDWPVAGYFIDGVQIMAVYRRPTRPSSPSSGSGTKSIKAPVQD